MIYRHASSHISSTPSWPVYGLHVIIIVHIVYSTLYYILFNLILFIFSNSYSSSSSLSGKKIKTQISNLVRTITFIRRAQCQKVGKPKILKVVEARKPNGPKQDSHLNEIHHFCPSMIYRHASSHISSTPSWPVYGLYLRGMCS
jgi:hypothetical protein